MKHRSSLALRLLTAAAAFLLAASIAQAQTNSSGSTFPGASQNSGFGSSQSGFGAVRGPGSMNPGQMAAAARKLGFSPSELMNLKNAAANGGLSPDEIQQICLHLSSKGIGGNQIEAMSTGLGLNLNAQQLAQLKSCASLTQGRSSQKSQGPQLLGEQNSRRQYPGSEAPSAIERTFRALDSGAPPSMPNPKTLSQFGYALFSQPVSTFAPVENVPVSDDYLIGPGDELKILLWGRLNDSLDLTVNRDGSILVPEFGPLQVAGLTFGQARKLIQDRGKQITGVNVDVTMGQLRTIQVFVIGEVNQPGAYEVSALSRVSNALAAAGGISKIGSLRRIELRRGNQTIRTIDLYQLLLSGNNAGDLQLEPNDVIFVPVVGPVAAVAGDVKRPAIYELSGKGASLASVLKTAGGITAFGYAQRVQVERVRDHARRVVLDVDLDQLRSRSFAIHDGDLIKVYSVLPRQTNVVKIDGNVNRPGSYQFYAGMRVADLLNEAEGVLPNTFFGYALLRRMHGPQRNVRLLPVNLDKALSDSANSLSNLELRPGDDLTIFSQTQIRDLPTVQITGEVRNPGYYVLNHQMRVSDLIYLAGGLRDDAYKGEAELARTSVVNGTTTSHVYMDVDLREALAGSDAQNPVLQPNDEVFIRRASNWHLPWVVTISGEVRRPGPYAIHKGERIASLLKRCGGLLPDAYLPATVFIRQSIKIMQQKRLDEARVQLQQQIAQLQLMPASFGGQNGNSAGNKKDTAEALSTMEAVLTQSQNQQAQGRLVVHLKTAAQLVNSPDNVELANNDRIAIPRRPVSVNVLGQVYTPNAIIYQPNLTVQDYLQMAGGPTQGADKDHIYVIKADGSILTSQGVKDAERSEMFPLLPVISSGLMGAHLQPGDTIYVPEQLRYVNKLEVARSMTQIIANSAMSLGVLGILGSSL